MNTYSTEDIKFLNSLLPNLCDDARERLSEIIRQRENRNMLYDRLHSTPEQYKSMGEIHGLEDQIGKQHWLNVHFRAFRLSYEAWQNHIAANAKMGSKECNSPGGAVLDSDRDGRRG